jgi:hypothetical protein
MEVGNPPPPQPLVDGSAPVPEPPARPSHGPGFSELLSGLGRRIDQGEGLMAHLQSPTRMDAAQPIALQAGIYRYTEAVELASKIVDRTSNAIKTTLQTQ